MSEISPPALIGNYQTKMRLDMADLTLEDLADVGELLGMALSDIMQGPKQALGIAAVAWVLHKRDDPTYTYEQARKLRLADIDLVNSAESEQPSGSNGVAPVLLPASGP
jgi:hypothetical protein